MRQLFFTLACIFLGSWISCFVTTCVLSVKLDQNCTGHLKRAADANTPELAIKELNVALSYLEEKGDTIGYTSILWTTPDEDLGFWYNNIKTCRDELLELPENASQMDKTNTLMKLRESLCDEGEYGTELTVPEGTSRYPHNLGFMLWRLISVILMAIFGFCWWYELDK